MNIDFFKDPAFVKLFEGISITKKHVELTFGKGVLNDLIDFWNTYEVIIFDYGLTLYGLESVMDQTEAFNIDRYNSDYILIGSDSGDNVFFLKKGDFQLNIYKNDLITLDVITDYEKLDIKFNDFINGVYDDSLHYLDDKEDVYHELIDIYIKVVPKDENRFILEIRKMLNLDKSIQDIKTGMLNLPFCILEKVILIKYILLLKEIQLKYNCIEVRCIKNNKLIDVLKC